MNGLLLLIIKYKYLLLLPVAILEGPFISVFAGFLVSVGIFNFFISYLIVVLGDMIGDSFYYGLGRWGGKHLIKRGARLGVTPERLETAKKYFAERHHRALITSKLVYGFGISGLIAAGALKISFRKYLRTCFLIAVCQSFILLTVGFFFGHAYLQIEKYLNHYTAFISILALFLMGFFIFRKLRKKYGKKPEAK